MVNVTSRNGFIEQCNKSYALSCRRTVERKSPTTLEAIEESANRLHEVAPMCSSQGRYAYSRVHHEFDRILRRCERRIDGDTECRSFGLHRPTKLFRAYREVCEDWKDSDLLDRVYLELTSKINHNEQYTSLFQMPKDSWTKAIILEDVVSRLGVDFDEMFLTYSEALRAWIGDQWVDRDTKVLIDLVSANRVFLNTLDSDKYGIVDRYLSSRDSEVVNWFGPASERLETLEYSETTRLFYINGAFYHSQRPELANRIKCLSPNSVVIMVVIDLFRGSRQRNRESYDAELIRYGLNPNNYDNRTDFNKVLKVFSRQCNHNVSFHPYGDNRVKDKYLAVIK